MVPEFCHRLVVDLHLLVKHAAAVGRIVVVEAVRELLVLFELVAQAFQFDLELP